MPSTDTILLTLSRMRLTAWHGSIAPIVVATLADKLDGSGYVDGVQSVEETEGCYGTIREARVNLSLLVTRKGAIRLLSSGDPCSIKM